MESYSVKVDICDLAPDDISIDEDVETNEDMSPQVRFCC